MSTNSLIKIHGLCVNCHVWHVRHLRPEVRPEDYALITVLGPFATLIEWKTKILCYECLVRCYEVVKGKSMEPTFDDLPALTKVILKSTASTEPSDFNEFCRGLANDNQLPTEREGWRTLFTEIRRLEGIGLLKVTREHAGAHKIESLRLTPPAADLVRAHLDRDRGLLGLMRKNNE